MFIKNNTHYFTRPLTTREMHFCVIHFNLFESSTQIFDLHEILEFLTSFPTANNINYLLTQAFTFTCGVFSIFFPFFKVLLRISVHFNIYSELLTFQSAGIQHQIIWIANLRNKQELLAWRYALIYSLEWFRLRTRYFVYHWLSNLRLVSPLNSC